MRLIDTETLALSEFFGDSIPKYAILSHTWGAEEVTFQDWDDLGKASRKKGFAKIEGACAKARSHGLSWVWVDTNCIDKTSSAELTEAINSMFQWYARSEVCYAYLSDVRSADAPSGGIRESRWFKRGWTLQELLAPERMTFYAADWSTLGSRNGSLLSIISDTTGIGKKYLLRHGRVTPQDAPVARKMSWLAGRTTTRVEDIAYCMLGLFDINMPLLYGEGIKAFTRLQHEIIKVSNDHTIFCWSWNKDVPENWTSILAHSPSQFLGCGRVVEISGHRPSDEISIYSMTNAGLSIQLPV
ncbi:heterokaryon incompatibility protein-domain-containing protein, partial [Cercophora newfieldiana]